MVRLTDMASERRLRDGNAANEHRSSHRRAVCWQPERMRCWQLQSPETRGQEDDKKCWGSVEREKNGGGVWFVACSFRQQCDHVISRSVTAQIADSEVRRITIRLLG